MRCQKVSSNACLLSPRYSATDYPFDAFKSERRDWEYGSRSPKALLYCKNMPNRLIYLRVPFPIQQCGCSSRSEKCSEFYTKADINGEAQLVNQKRTSLLEKLGIKWKLAGMYSFTKFITREVMNYSEDSAI